MSAAEFRAREDKRRLATCQHFNGVQFHRCKAGVAYSSVRGSVPYSHACIRTDRWHEGGRPECEHYVAQTLEQVEADYAELKRRLALHAKGLSGCCEAPLDLQQVITSGRHKGHGPRFCSKCGVIAFLV
jgi:hypothetical protein